MFRTLLLGGSLALAMLSGPAQTRAVTPAWGSDQVRAARNIAAAPAIVFSYHRVVSEKSAADETDTGQVTLGADFTAINSPEANIIDDFALCRTLVWHTGKDEVDNQSCYFMPAFRVSELANRRGLSAFLGSLADENKAKVKPEMLDPYWAEQELVMQAAPSSALTSVKTATQTEWRLKGQVVVRISLSGTAFSPGERQAFARYFARNVDLHPQIRTAVLDAGMLPDSIVIERRSSGKASTETLQFSGLKRQAAAYPLPAHLRSTLSDRADGAGLEAAGLRQAFAAIDGSARPAKPAFDDLLTQMEAAAADHRPLEAGMLFFELTQQYGGVLQSGTPEMTQLRAHGATLRAILDSPEVKPFMQASDIAGGSGDAPSAEAAAHYLAKATEFDKVAFGTFRYVTFANLAGKAKGTDKWDKAIFSAMPSLTDCYWKHIAAYPWASNAFKDLGDTYYVNFEFDKAWQAWDLGRAIDPDWKLGVMSGIGKYEDSLRQQNPENF